MDDRDPESGTADDGIDRRTLLKGTAAAGLAGAGLSANASADDATLAEELPHEITLEPETEDARVSYRFRVNGTVAKASEAGTLGVDRILHGTVVQGKVGGTIEGNEDPVDVYRFSGSIAFDEADGPLTVTLDIGGDGMGSDAGGSTDTGADDDDGANGDDDNGRGNGGDDNDRDNGDNGQGNGDGNGRGNGDDG